MEASGLQFRINNLVARYNSLVALRGISLEFGAGERIGIFGHNGSGKSTLLKCLVGGLSDVSGQVSFEDREIQPGNVYRNIDLGIGVVPQTDNVFPSLTVAQCLDIASLRGQALSIAEIGDLFPVLSERHHQRAGSMSGGEQQILSVGMALVPRPRALLLDEPTAGLAPVVARTMLKSLAEINKRFGTTIIVVEQNVLLALDLVERAIVLRSGSVVFDGLSSDLRRKEDLWTWF